MPGDSKTEKATPKKRRDERKEGNIFQSTDVVNVVFLLTAFLALQFLFPPIIAQVGLFMEKFIGLIGSTTELTASDATAHSLDFATTYIMLLLPFIAICMIVGILAHGVQTKFLFVAKSFYPKLRNINPLEGIKKLFSLKNFVELIKNLLKVILLIVIVYTMLSAIIPEALRTLDMQVSDAVTHMFGLGMNMVFVVLAVFAVVAFFDYLFQRWEYERKIKMSKQEVKEEFKQTEGNPEIKGKIRELQRQRARQRMMQAVPSADVIIRNPTHFAVALRYDNKKDRAPVVLAKGQDELALRIIKVAEEHDVSVIENRPLARALFAQAELDREIPSEYYGAVAEILVYVYKLKHKLR